MLNLPPSGCISHEAATRNRLRLEPAERETNGRCLNQDSAEHKARGTEDGKLTLLVVCLVVGFALNRTGRLPAAGAAALSAYVINLGLPAVAFAYLPHLEFNQTVLLSIGAPWLMFLIGAGLFWLAGRWLNLARETIGCLMLVGGLANTSMVGLPMIEVFFGRELLPVGLLIDLLGSYLILSVVATPIACWYGAEAPPPPGKMVRQIVTFPPFAATVLALLLSDVPYPPWLQALFERLAGTMAPVALVSIGCQLGLSGVHNKLRPVLLGLSYKLLLGPAAIFCIYFLMSGSRDPIAQITVFEMAMPPMIAATVVAMEYDLDPALATLLVTAGIPLAFVTLPLWHFALVAT